MIPVAEMKLCLLLWPPVLLPLQSADPSETGSCTGSIRAYYSWSSEVTNIKLEFSLSYVQLQEHGRCIYRSIQQITGKKFNGMLER